MPLCVRVFVFSRISMVYRSWKRQGISACFACKYYRGVVKAARSAAEDHLMGWERCVLWVEVLLGSSPKWFEVAIRLSALPVPLLRQDGTVMEQKWNGNGTVMER